MSFRNNYSVSIRHLKADKTNSFISIVGLILGLGIVAVVLIFLLNELSYDRSYANQERIVRVLNHNETDNNTWANTPFVIGETAKNKLSEVESYAHQYNMGNIEVKKDQEFLSEPDVMGTESSFFNIFGIKIAQGSLADFDDANGKILISQASAKKYFGKENPVGQSLTLRYNGMEFPLEVAAVYCDLPKNSSIKASLITNIRFGIKHLAANIKSNGALPSEDQFREAWQGVFFTNYLLLKKGVDTQNLEAKLLQLGKENSAEPNKLKLSLQPLSDIYFGSAKIVDNNRKEMGNRSMLMILGFIGILILIIACINYLNLASAKAMTQVKGLAVRKVCGASQTSLINQHLFESILVSLIALPFAILVSGISLPFVSHMLGKSYTIAIDKPLILSLTLLLLTTLLSGFITGSFIATTTSRFSLVSVLKGNRTEKREKHWARKSMVVFQIAVFIALVAIMLLVQKQVRYAFSKDLGFAKEGLICVPLGDHNLDRFKQEIAKNPNVISASGTLWMPPSQNKMYVSIPKVNNHTEMVNVNGLFVDYGFASTMGMKIIMGSDFDKEKNSGGVVLVNESAIKALGLTDVLGEKTAFGTVVGVVSDFNMYSLHEAITPMIIGLNPGMSQNIAIRLRTENLLPTIDFLKKAWVNTGGTSAFSFQFTDEILNNIYDSDIRFSKIIGLLAVIAIAIASLGLFGLSLLTSKQRIKEIGVRKVNGAKISEILVLLNSEFVKWVAIAFLIATPVAWFAMHRWLENFAYQTTLSWWIFVLSGVLALGIALLTVSFQTYKAAVKNPIESLRYE